MDPKTQMPDIKAEVLKTDDGKKKGAGLLGLFGGGGGGAAGGLGGLGAGAAGAGGLLATKAGMLALVLIGTSVAGGIGVAGYKIFGPGEADRTGGNFSLFAPKPPQAADASASAGAASGDGSSQSLTLMAQSAAKDREAEASASAAVDAPTDAVAGDAAKDAAGEAARREAEARAAAGGAINSGGGAGAVGSMRGLANVKKLGALSGVTGGGASTTASSGPAGKLGDNLAAASRNGATSGFSRGGAGAKASGAKGRAARGGRGARQQARNVMGDQAGGRAGSSFSAGRTYDGSATQAGGAIGPDGGVIGMGGVGDGAAGEQPKALAANSIKDSHELTPPPAKPDPIVTPWEKALNNAMMAVALAGALMMAASMLLKDVVPVSKAWTVTLAKVLLGLAVAASALALFFAGQATFGPGGQKTQGGLIMAAAVLAGGMSAYMLTQIWSMDATTDANAKVLSESMAGNSMLIKVIGGGAAVALIGSMMIPKKSMKESEAKEKGYPTSYHAPAPQQNYRV